MEMAGGSTPAGIDICEGPDTLQSEWSATYTEMAGGSPRADRDICDGPDTLQTEPSMNKTERDIRDVDGNGRWKSSG